MVSIFLFNCDNYSIYGGIKMGKDKLWVVEAITIDGWDICNFAGLPYTSHKFFIAHKMKDNIIEKLIKLKNVSWKKNMFRVIEYRRK